MPPSPLELLLELELELLLLALDVLVPPPPPQPVTPMATSNIAGVASPKYTVRFEELLNMVCPLIEEV